MKVKFFYGQWVFPVIIFVILVFLVLFFVLGNKLTVEGSNYIDGAFGVLEDFEGDDIGPYNPSHLWYWSWGPDSEEWRSMSALDIEENGTNKYLRMSVDDDILNAITHFNFPGSLANLNSVHSAFIVGDGVFSSVLSPRADALRAKFKIEQGNIGLTFGSPVSNLGNSDVLAKVKYLSPENIDDCSDLEDGWIQCEFDLTRNLIRNSRRSNYSGDNQGQEGTIKNLEGEEVIYYSRWVQEPLSLYIVSYDSNDNRIISGDPIVLIDDIELVNKNRGKTFSVFDSVDLINLIQDFEDSIENVFTVNFNWFNNSQPPANLGLSDISNTGDKSLLITSKTAEEFSWTGFDAHEGEGANAVSFEIKVDYPNTKFSQHVIDFIALATPTGEEFSWTGLLGENGFNYQLSENSTADLDFSVYHSRRIIPHNKWVTVTIPFVDFVAAYGSGEMVNHHKEQKPLIGSEISVIGLQAGFRQRFDNTSIYLDSVKYVNVPGSVDDLRSYWQEYAYNISEGFCHESWTCTSWSACSNGSQTRTCTDLNVCGTTKDKPTESQSCTLSCVPNWVCGAWSECSHNTKTRICIDNNGCEVVTDKPDTIQSCTLEMPDGGGGGGAPASPVDPVAPPETSPDSKEDNDRPQFLDGTLIRSDVLPLVYLLDSEGKRRLIPTEGVFLANKFSWDDIQVIPQTEINVLEKGDDVTYPDGALLKSHDNSAVYLINDGSRLVFFNAKYFLSNSHAWEDIISIPQEELNKFTISDNVVYPDGTLIQGDGPSVYILEEGKRRRITTADVFNTLKLAWHNIIGISPFEFTFYEEGQPIYQASDLSLDVNAFDTDNDTLYDYLERIFGTSINNPDSDGDGHLDGIEVKYRYNPLGVGR